MASSTIDPPSTQISELSISELKEECQKYTQISVQEKKMFMDVIDLITNSLREMNMGECENLHRIEETEVPAGSSETLVFPQNTDDKDLGLPDPYQSMPESEDGTKKLFLEPGVEKIPPEKVTIEKMEPVEGEKFMLNAIKELFNSTILHQPETDELHVLAGLAKSVYLHKGNPESDDLWDLSRNQLLEDIIRKFRVAYLNFLCKNEDSDQVYCKISREFRRDFRKIESTL